MGDGFAWTIPLIQLCFAVLFVAARRAGAAREAGVYGGAYLLNAAAFTVSMLDPLLPSRVISGATDILFALSFYRFADALQIRYDVRVPRTARLALLGLALAAPLLGVAAGSLLVELLGSDLGCALQVGLVLALVGRGPARWIDRALLGLSWLVVLVNVGRAASVPVTAANATFQSFLGTTYSYLMYADGMVTGLIFGALALVAVTTDLVARYRRDAHVDPLTGLLNRRGLDAAASMLDPAFSAGLVACDLDRFKLVNDTFGHDVGDRVLVAYADLVRSVLPPDGVAARVGGEEFVLILPGHAAKESKAIVARLADAMARYDWSIAGLGWRQSASFGLAGIGGGGATLAAALRTADRALYEAKRCGRDRICELIAA